MRTLLKAPKMVSVRFLMSDPSKFKALFAWCPEHELLALSRWTNAHTDWRVVPADEIGSVFDVFNSKDFLDADLECISKDLAKACVQEKRKVSAALGSYGEVAKSLVAWQRHLFAEMCHVRLGSAAPGHWSGSLLPEHASALKAAMKAGDKMLKKLQDYEMSAAQAAIDVIESEAKRQKEEAAKVAVAKAKLEQIAAAADVAIPKAKTPSEPQNTLPSVAASDSTTLADMLQETQ